MGKVSDNGGGIFKKYDNIENSPNKNQSKKKRDIPKYIETANKIKKYIIEKNLSKGDKLPGGRTLSEMFHISKNVIYEALEHLNNEGTIEILKQSGCIVKNIYTTKNVMQWDSYINCGWQTINKEYVHAVALSSSSFTVDLSSLIIHQSFLYQDYFLKTLKKYISAKEYIDIYKTQLLGLNGLRESIAKIFQSRGINAAAERVVITAGVESAIELIIRSTLSAGDTIYTEEPAMLTLCSLASSIGINIVTIPMDRFGLRIDMLKEKYEKSKRSLLITTTFCQVPTGINMSQRRRVDIYNFCQYVNMPILETDCQWYPDKLFKPIASYDTDHRVIYSSGPFMPFTNGFNIGWMHVPEQLISKIAGCELQVNPYPNALNHKIFEIMITSGLYDEFIAQLYPKFIARMELTDKLLNKYLSDYAEWSSDKIVFWIKFYNNINVIKFLLINQEVSVIPGFMMSKKFANFIFILPYAVDDEELENGIKIISEKIKQCIK